MMNKMKIINKKVNKLSNYNKKKNYLNLLLNNLNLWEDLMKKKNKKKTKNKMIMMGILVLNRTIIIKINFKKIKIIVNLN